MTQRIDPFFVLMIAAVITATVFPASGNFASVFDMLGTLGVSLLFFLHGAALSPQAVLSGLRQWQLHLFILAITFAVFPILVQPIAFISANLLPPDLQLGFLYLAVLPSAVSSSIAFTSIARGNVPAAICSSAGSNVLGLLLTPLLMSFLISTSTEGALDLGQSLQEVLVQLLLPFGLGQAAHWKVGGFLNQYKNRLEQYDQTLIVVIIYAAFSQSVTSGLWQVLPPFALLTASALCLVLLVAVFAFAMYGSRKLGFSRQDEIAAAFCGSKKSLATGLPLAQVLFGGAAGFGMIVLPIMLYNQIQILVGTMLAHHYAKESRNEAA